MMWLASEMQTDNLFMVIVQRCEVNKDMAGLIRLLHRRKLALRAIPESWLAILNEHVSFYRRLADEDRTRFLQYHKQIV